MNKKRELPRGKRRGGLVIVVGLVLIASAAVAADWWYCLPADQKSSYVGRQSCAECHQQQVNDWTGSDHHQAMALASDESVLANFDDQQLTYQGVTSRMFKRDGKFFIHTEGPDGRMQDFQIKYTFGIRPLQQYMVEFPDGRVQVLRVSWDTAKKRWFYVPPPDVADEKIEPGDPLHWTGAAQNWNHMCADCHSTDVHKNYDLASDTFKTSFSEINVSCEACHGPGSTHIELARSKSLFWDRRHGYGLAKLKDKQSHTQIETCAKCHARRNIVHPNFTPGEPLLDAYEPSLIHENLYHADGQILDEVYVYGSFVQSRMYREKVRCSDCHDPHTARVKFEGNRLCTQCHQPGKYDGPVHHHHKVGSKGASCVECHMPATTYMVVDPRRDHSLRVPRPDLSVELGTPNACNGCHTKPAETAQWAAQKVVEWYGERRADDPHYAPALAAARRGDPEGEGLLLKTLRRKKTPEIIRATAVELLARYPSQKSADARLQALRDSSPLVNAAAARSVPDIAPGRVLNQLGPLLDHPRRAVRIASARRLVDVPSQLLMPNQQELLKRGLDEFKTAQLASSDRGGAHLALGSLYQQLGQTQQAVEEYKTAIRLEPYLTGGRSNLAALYTQLEHDEQEIRSLREQEAQIMARNVRLLPENASLRADYAIMLHLLDKNNQAEAELAAACKLEPNTYYFHVLLTELYIKQEKWDEALRVLKHRQTINPADPSINQAIQGILRAASSGSQP